MTDVIERTEVLAPGPALALGALLGVAVPDLEGGAGLPLLWHWFYLLERPAQADLGPDGHPVRGALPAPPGPGRRRMWAGGRVRMFEALRCGETATRRSTALSVEDKQGRSGPLTFVVVQHQILQRGKVVIDERQELVYRAAAGQHSQGAAAALPPGGPPTRDAEAMPAADGEWQIDTSPVLLFRFSALTYNAHRIHYDRDYARDAEGYPGLLTHGPLQALAMAEAARAGADQAQSDQEHEFVYRLESPLFDYQGMVVRATREGAITTTSVRDIHGRRTASGTLGSAGR